MLFFYDIILENFRHSQAKNLSVAENLSSGLIASLITVPCIFISGVTKASRFNSYANLSDRISTHLISWYEKTASFSVSQSLNHTLHAFLPHIQT